MLKIFLIVVTLVKGGTVLAVCGLIAYAFWPEGILARPIGNLTLEEFLLACGSVFFGLFGVALFLRVVYIELKDIDDVLSR